MEEKDILSEQQMTLPQSPQIQQEDDEDGINIVDILMRCINNWYWFVFCTLIMLSIAFLHIKKQEPIYSRSATILIKEEANANSSNKLGVQEDMGVFKPTNTVANEIIAIQSPQVVGETVRRLRLFMNYSRDGRFHDKTLYGSTCPIDVIMEDIKDDEWANLIVEVANEGVVILRNFSRGNSDEIVTGKLGDRLQTPLGVVVVNPSESYNGQLSEVYVRHWSVEATAGTFQGRLNVRQREKTSVIDLYFSDVSTERAEDFLKKLIDVYSEFWVNDRNRISASTNAFISERIAIIEKELGSVDSDISTYKSENLIPNLDGSIGQNMAQASSANQQIIELHNQLSMAQYIREYIQKKENEKSLIPAVSGFGAEGVESLISTYNSKILERNTLLSSSFEQNPLVIELDEQLQNLHIVILKSLDNQILAINNQLESSKTTETKANAKMANNPEQAKYLLSVERQQAVKQALYTFLLQKREENELSQAFTAYNTRILNPPSGGSKPASPDTQKIYLIAFGAGMAIPIIIIVLLEMLNTTVRGRKDVEYMQTPFLGEIPQVLSDKRNLWKRLDSSKSLSQFLKNETIVTQMLMKLGLWKKDDSQSDKSLKLFVKAGSRNQINEAFRVVRSNMEFMQGNANNIAIMVTSANAGSGKTFITLNLGASFAIKGKKILAVDLDFRKRSLSKIVNKPKIGLTDYLANRVTGYENLIVKSSLMDNLDILPVGSIPPNPTELLYDEKLGLMLDKLKKEYDIVFLDCPPIEIVADASIVAKYADKTIFMIRAGLLQRAMLPEIDRFYFTKKFGNMSIMLNGTDDSYSKYGYSKYGYRYGYHYGYGGHYAKEGYIDN